MKEITMREDEYLDETTGQILCKTCHQVRWKPITFAGSTWNMHVSCACQEKKLAEEKKQREHQEYLDQIQRNRSVGMQEKALRTCTFERDKGLQKESIYARKYVKHWEEMKKKATGLIFWGDVGTGKTFLAACIANALTDQGVKVMMTNFSRILNDLTDFKERNARLDELNRYDLLILDDLGAERCTDFVLEQIFSVIDTRYRSQKPMIVTTNLTMEEMKNPANRSLARIYDRILHRCIPVCVSGNNIRRQQAAENMKTMGSLLKE